MNRTPALCCVVLLISLLCVVGGFADGRSPAYFGVRDPRGILQRGCFGQSAEEGEIVLDANNGFFDPGKFVAEGDRVDPAWDRESIGKHFDAPLVASDRDAPPLAAMPHLIATGIPDADLVLVMNAAV
jgi:hypothetical protein